MLKFCLAPALHCFSFVPHTDTCIIYNYSGLRFVARSSLRNLLFEFQPLSFLRVFIQRPLFPLKRLRRTYVSLDEWSATRGPILVHV